VSTLLCYAASLPSLQGEDIFYLLALMAGAGEDPSPRLRFAAKIVHPSFSKFTKFSPNPQNQHSSVIQKKLKHKEPRNCRNAEGASWTLVVIDTRPNFKS